MLKFAVLHDNIIINIIVAESKEIAESVVKTVCIEISDDLEVDIGHVWNGSSFVRP